MGPFGAQFWPFKGQFGLISLESIDLVEIQYPIIFFKYKSITNAFFEIWPNMGPFGAQFRLFKGQLGPIS